MYFLQHGDFALTWATLLNHVDFDVGPCALFDIQVENGFLGRRFQLLLAGGDLSRMPSGIVWLFASILLFRR